MVCVLNARRRVFTSDDLLFLESVANVIGSGIERSESEQTIRHQAMHDALTGIPNRVLLHDRLQLALDRAGRDGTLVGVLYIDLDRFKDVNDSYGHSTGDALLVAAAERLTATLRPGDTVARVGGDEFAVIAEALAGPEEALALAERLLRALADPERSLPGASIGIAVRQGGDSVEEAMRDADTALYRAKAAGRGRAELFDNEMRARMLDRLQTEADLRGALERREFDLYYQPIVALADGTVAAVEGLIRWQHPTRGLVPPVAFIGIAEETGAIVEMGRFVIARACADAARWNAMCPGSPIAVNVNLSALQLADAGLADFVETSLAASGIPASQLGLEITETVVFDDNPEHVARLLQIKRLGVRLLLDDFGTGYSSLGHLRRFPLDVLKLDRTFVAGVGSRRDGHGDRGRDAAARPRAGAGRRRGGGRDARAARLAAGDRLRVRAGLLLCAAADARGGRSSDHGRPAVAHRRAPRDPRFRRRLSPAGAAQGFERGRCREGSGYRREDRHGA